MQIGEFVRVKVGAMDMLRRRNCLAPYITQTIDNQTGKVVADHRDAVGFPHLGVDLGFSEPVGIPAAFLERA